MHDNTEKYLITGVSQSNLLSGYSNFVINVRSRISTSFVFRFPTINIRLSMKRHEIEPLSDVHVTTTVRDTFAVVVFYFFFEPFHDVYITHMFTNIELLNLSNIGYHQTLFTILMSLNSLTSLVLVKYVVALPFWCRLDQVQVPV